jgi:hypothetical protein
MTVKFMGKVGPVNLNSSYADPFVVFADSRPEAVTKAVALSGYEATNARVWITSFEEQAPA